MFFLYLRADRVTFVVGSDAKIANDDVAGVDTEIAFDCDSVSRCRLSGDGDVIVPDPNISVDCPRDIEDDDSRSLGLACFACRLPGPEAFRLVTRITRPPRPPVVLAP